MTSFMKFLKTWKHFVKSISFWRKNTSNLLTQFQRYQFFSSKCFTSFGVFTKEMALFVKTANNALSTKTTKIKFLQHFDINSVNFVHFRQHSVTNQESWLVLYGTTLVISQMKTWSKAFFKTKTSNLKVSTFFREIKSIWQFC